MSKFRTKAEILFFEFIAPILGIELNGHLSPNDLATEVLTEKAMAVAGGYKWVGDKNLEYDFDDKSDCKTSSIKYPNCIKGTITSTGSKVGPLRVPIANIIADTVDYFFIPLKDVRELERPSSNKCGTMQIDYSYNIAENHYGRIEPFRCKDKKDCATRK